MASGISVLLPTYNCAEVVRNTLESVEWADEILVVDSFSTDSTLDVCREYGARIIQHEYQNSAKQKNWAIPQCSHEWVLQIDSDEVMEPGLKEEVQVLVANCPPTTAGFRIPFKHHVLGEWMRVCGLYPEHHLRLFRRDAGQFEDKEVHAHVRLCGEVGVTQHHILHFGMPNISKQLSNLDRYSRYQADQMRKCGKQFRVTDVVLRPAAAFIYWWIAKQGFRGGRRGLVLAAYSAMSVFWAYAKLWEIREMGYESSPLE